MSEANRVLFYHRHPYSIKPKVLSVSTIDYQILKLVQLHGPIKARKISTILSEEFSKHVDRSGVNSALYRMKSLGKVIIDESYQWSLAEVSTADPTADSGLSNMGITVADTEAPTIIADIIFTDEQQTVIDLDPSGHLLIRGQAGSGKTTVLAARAGKIISAMNKGSLLFLTYNAALCAYVKKAFSQAGMKGDIDVHTFHDWSKGCARELGADFNGWVDGKARSEVICKIIEEAKLEIGQHRLFDISDSARILEWWGDEIAWLFGQHVIKLDDYLKKERTTRGTAIRVTKDDRRFVWFVYESYVEWLEESNKEDYDNPAGLILRTIEQQGKDIPDELRYDHVMVDEVQDFDMSWLLAVVKISRVSLSLSGDLAQKIYRRSFAWKDCGINVRGGGRSRKLGSSHRTTCQIMDVAEYLLLDNDVTKSDDFTPPVRPQKNGSKVKRLIDSSPKIAYERGYDWVAAEFKRMRTTSVVVALPFSRQLYPAQKALEKRGVSVKAAKGASLGNFNGGVVVTTYHQLKGLEFDHVVIMGLHDAQYPGRLLERIPEEDRDDEVQLLRRLLYVAMTRAKSSVAVIGSVPFCRFFSGVPDEHFEHIPLKKPAATKKTAKKKPAAKIGAVTKAPAKKPAIKKDPIEDDAKFKAIIENVDKIVDKKLENHPWRNGMGYCHAFWETKKQVLKEDYNINWRTPSEMNPDIMFD